MCGAHQLIVIWGGCYKLMKVPCCHKIRELCFPLCTSGLLKKDTGVCEIAMYKWLWFHGVQKVECLCNIQSNTDNVVVGKFVLLQHHFQVERHQLCDYDWFPLKNCTNERKKIRMAQFGCHIQALNENLAVVFREDLAKETFCRNLYPTINGYSNNCPPSPPKLLTPQLNIFPWNYPERFLFFLFCNRGKYFSINLGNGSGSLRDGFKLFKCFSCNLLCPSGSIFSQERSLPHSACRISKLGVVHSIQDYPVLRILIATDWVKHIDATCKVDIILLGYNPAKCVQHKITTATKGLQPSN